MFFGGVSHCHNLHCLGGSVNLYTRLKKETFFILFQSYNSFFFWIIKNLFPKGKSPTKNTHEVKKDPKKRKTDSTSPKTEEEGHQPETKNT